MKNAMQNLKHLPFGGASAVWDLDVLSTIKAWQTDTDIAQVLSNPGINQDFLQQYRDWISRSSANRLNLGNFPISAFSNGTSESFDKFYLRHSRRRFRCFRGEYMYHAAAWRNYFPNWCRIEDDAINANDAVIMSLPFSDTGNEHPSMRAVLDRCDLLGVPVLIDCAFFGICRDIKFDFDHECITDITFSLSKTFPVANARIGMRLTRVDDDDSLLVHHKTNYTNWLGADLGLTLIKQYSADYNVSKWHSTQLAFCQELKIAPSNTVIFGLARDSFAQYNRGGSTNRLCFARYLSSGQLPT
jgi:hypothetical protein